MVSRATQWIIPPEIKGNERVILFSACDAGYLDYAISLIRSVDIFSPGFTFSLHVVNPAPNTIDRINRMLEVLKSTRLSVSFETIDLSRLSLDQKRAYYASARFLQISHILSECSLPVFSVDADSLVVNPFDLNFSDKVDAQVIITRRDLLEEQPEHLAILTGSIWFAPLPNVIEFLSRVAADIDRHFTDGSLKWFIDQRVFYRRMKDFAKRVKFYNLKRKYADWEFGHSSMVWAGKGGRKLYDLRFFIFQNLLSDDDAKRKVAQNIVQAFFTQESNMITEWMHQRIQAAVYLTKRIAFYIPRLDLPWKRSSVVSSLPKPLTDDVIELRLYWKEFALRLASALERAGLSVDIFELPNWEINRERVEADGSALALIPHRCHIDFEDGKTPVLFYMQEFFRWAFVVNDRGWSAASSIYPVILNDIYADGQAFDRYRRQLLEGTLPSKFGQRDSKTKLQLLVDGLIPRATNSYGQLINVPRDYIFFPLQIPTDQSIQYFSDLAELDVVEALVAWARKNGVAIVLKPHPANMKSMKSFESLADGETVFYSDANIQDLINHSLAVYTINSGVGFEALLQLKPVVTFGRVEYDCVSFNANLNNLDEAWGYIRGCSVPELELKYSKFVNWFLECYAVDMSNSDASSLRLNEIAAQVVLKVCNSELHQG
ncbi:capsule polysaccharide export protein [Pseudomonas sp. GM50]|uniref:capsular polysaccharide export protein, LipB/KpsS family n=1 Tax=Pseudomonas sp. GM50 TaxID=1144332 RepID=UPI00027090AC|nr:capsule polysaccharide export protein [Pseudomonas sp. GM50]EJM65082.1 capsule polysaccharide export protein [Pseudomonas sp. GM50]